MKERLGKEGLVKIYDYIVRNHSLVYIKGVRLGDAGLVLGVLSLFGIPVLFHIGAILIIADISMDIVTLIMIRRTFAKTGIKIPYSMKMVKEINIELLKSMVIPLTTIEYYSPEPSTKNYDLNDGYVFTDDPYKCDEFTCILRVSLDDSDIVDTIMMDRGFTKDDLLEKVFSKMYSDKRVFKLYKIVRWSMIRNNLMRTWISGIAIDK